MKSVHAALAQEPYAKSFQRRHIGHSAAHQAKAPHHPTRNERPTPLRATDGRTLIET
jgi:hypothetical protein